MTFFCPIVIYNSLVEKSVAFNSLYNANMKDCIIIVVDNSIDKYASLNHIFCEMKQICYIKMPGNVGLSKATNAALDYISKLKVDDQDIVITLNDDTSITADYMSILKKTAEKYVDIDIFAPFMQGQNGILYSPAKQGFFKNHYPRTVHDEIPQKKYFAIYSCCCCRWSVYKDYRFDEDIFMDLIDNNFCDDQRKKNKKFLTINAVIQQNYAMKNKGLSRERVQKRMKIWIPDFLVYCKKRPVRMLGYLPAIAARGVMFSIKSKSIRVWFWMMGWGIKSLISRSA